jgi:hypothetical protein
MLIASSSKAKPDIKISPAEANRRWMDIAIPGQEPLRPSLSGLKVEYRVIQLYSRDAGPREATLKFDVGQGTQDLGFRNELPMLFQSAASVAVPLHIRDEDGNPTACSLLIRDPMGRVYPNPSRRLAPDFFFHHQIYRFDGEDVRLPPGTYHVTANRGPEYLPIEMDVVVANAEKVEPIVVNLRRWVHMADLGWFSGDHHVHRRCWSRGHDASHTGRRSQCGLRSQLGSLLVSPETVFRRRNVQILASQLLNAIRCRSEWFPVLARGPSVFVELDRR